jgi:hypothetical protein
MRKRTEKQESPDTQEAEGKNALSKREIDRMLWGFALVLGLVAFIELTRAKRTAQRESTSPRPPLNAEYLLYLLLRGDEREALIGDLVEVYGQVLRRFGKRRADFWFCKQVFGSLWPLLRRTFLKISALVWLGRIVRRFIS